MTNEEILAQVKFFVGFIGAVEVYSHVNTRFLVLGGECVKAVKAFCILRAGP